MKKLFKGKKKLATIPLAVILGLIFLPFVIGGGLGYLAFKKVGNFKLRFGILAIVAFFTLFIGSAWVAGLTSPAKPQPTTEAAKQEDKVDFNESQAVKPSEQPSGSPLAFKAQTAPNNPNIVLAKVTKVTKVIDGDTIEVDLGNGNIKTVRYIGIDTPETVDPRKSVQCFGKEASAKNKELVGGGAVGLEKDISETDKYGRLLRYVYMGDLLINQFLVAEGYAYSSSYPPDIKYQDKFKVAEQQAKASNKGLWGSCSTPTTTPSTQTSGSTQTTGSYSGGDKDCGDFSTHAEAQAFFISQGGPGSDPHKLDADHDGDACETLP
ncbi:MAG: thermonuclease family protein [Candidatus Levybacteria bacterium]|nr:thermonuclease family protein [Candidatus Levybacteria bacterium]